MTAAGERVRNLATLEGPDVGILITQDANGKNRSIQAALKIDPKFSSYAPLTATLQSLGLPREISDRPQVDDRE